MKEPNARTEGRHEDDVSLIPGGDEGATNSQRIGTQARTREPADGR
jgi:hypothetical protein